MGWWSDRMTAVRFSNLSPPPALPQASWRGYRQRKAYLQRLHYLRAHGDAVVKVGLLCLHPRLTPLCHRQGMRRVPSCSAMGEWSSRAVLGGCAPSVG